LPAHPDLLTAFGAALRGGPLPPGVTARDPSEAERRFAVYRNNVAVSLTDALAARFPVILRLVGEAFFRAMARLYAEADRPRSPVLAEWGAGFAGFLQGFPPLADYPWMPDVARLEFARGQAFHAADAAPVDPARLAGADPATLVLGLHPSVAVLALPCPAVTIWARNQPGGEGLPPGQGPETALILRDPGFQVPVRRIEPGDAALITALQRRLPLSEAAARAAAAAPGHDPGPILVHLMGAGAIVSAENRP
jgi:hypothetical protein